MNVKSVEKQEKSQVELVIEVNGQEWADAVEKVYKSNRNKLNVPGFRKGKAPRKIIETMYGNGIFHEDAIEALYPKAYAQAVEQEKLEVVAHPKVEISSVDEAGFVFKVAVTVRPEVTISNYKGLSAVKGEITVADEDVEKELKPLIEQATRLVSVDREAKTGDTVTIDFEGKKDGVPFEGGTSQGHSLELGSGSFIPGFEEGVVGMKAGDERDIELTFPKEYQVEELAGQPVVFTVKVTEVKEHVAPELDDEFAKDVSEFDTLEELKASLSEKVRARREQDVERAFGEALTDQLIEHLEVDLPESMVDYQTERMVEDYAMRIQSQGMAFEQFLSMTGMNVETLKEQAREGARRQVLSELALSAVVDAEQIEVTEEDVTAEIEKLAKQYQLEAEEVRAAVTVDDLRKDIGMRKAADLVKTHAVISEAKPEEAVSEEENA
ncbi:MAG: trigger factor [Oscillospiraceae bacterium]|nr:trigger factor [Oscillospiraceae bacterium]